MGGIFNNTYDPGRGPAKSFLAEEDAGKNKSIILPTVLRVGADELAYWTNMTCLYDKQWNFDPKLSTTPFCFFHIASVREVTVAQTAERRVIVYQAPRGSGTGAKPSTVQSSAYRSNLEVIMDNVVVQPKHYQMEVIIPNTLIGPYIQQGVTRLSAMSEFMGLSGALDDDTASLIETGLRGAQTFFTAVSTASKMADLILGSMETGSTQMATMNKNSITAMVGSGHVLCFKKWTGYDYSYGVLTNVDISKKPNEEGVYRGSLTFQETPILNISQRDTSKTLTGWSGIAASVSYVASQTARIVSLASAMPFMKITGVMDEAGAPGSDTNEKAGFAEFSMTNLF